MTKRSVRLLIVFVMLFSTLMQFELGTVYAYEMVKDGEGERYGGWEDPVTTWGQSNMPESRSLILPGTMGLTMGTASCGWFGAYFALYKAGFVDPSNYNVKNLIEDGKNKGTYFGGWLLDYSKLGELFPDRKISSLKDEDKSIAPAWWNSYGVSLSGKSFSDAIKIMKTFVDMGYYCVVCLRNSETSGHYVFLDYVNPDNPNDFRIGDSGFRKTWLSEYKGYDSGNMTFGEMWVLDLSEGKTENLNINRKSIYEDGAGGGNNSPLSKEDGIKILSEMKIEGMGNYQGNLSQFQVPVYPGWKFNDPFEIANARKIAESKVSNRGLKAANTAISVGGFCLVGYAVFLLIFYFVYGKVYPKAMMLVFFGRYVVSKDIKPDGKGISVLSFSKRLGIMLFLGIAMASGLALRWVVAFLSLLK